MKKTPSAKGIPERCGIIITHSRHVETVILITNSGSNLTFTEVMSKKLYFRLAEGSVREVTSSLADFEDKLLARTEFVKVHRSYIANFWKAGELGLDDGNELK